MVPGSVAIANPTLAQFAPSTAGFVVGSPSPADSSMTQIVNGGNSFISGWMTTIESLPQAAITAVTTVSDQAKYKGDKILGTVAKTYNQALSGAYGAVADGGQAALNVAKKVETVAAVGTAAIGMYILIPLILVWFSARNK